MIFGHFNQSKLFCVNSPVPLKNLLFGSKWHETCVAAKNQYTRSAGSNDKIGCQDQRSTGSHGKITKSGCKIYRISRQNKKLGSRMSGIPLPNQKIKIQDLQDPIRKRIQDPISVISKIPRISRQNKL